MKKLGKLNVNSQNSLSNEELLKLKGGDTEYCCMCYNSSGTEMGYMLLVSETECYRSCITAYPSGSGLWYC